MASLRSLPWLCSRQHCALDLSYSPHDCLSPSHCLSLHSASCSVLLPYPHSLTLHSSTRSIHGAVYSGVVVRGVDVRARFLSIAAIVHRSPLDHLSIATFAPSCTPLQDQSGSSLAPSLDAIFPDTPCSNGLQASAHRGMHALDSFNYDDRGSLAKYLPPICRSPTQAFRECYDCSSHVLAVIYCVLWNKSIRVFRVADH